MLQCLLYGVRLGLFLLQRYFDSPACLSLQPAILNVQVLCHQLIRFQP